MPGKLMDKIYLSQKGHIFAAKRKLYNGKYPMNVEWMNFLFQLLRVKFTIIYCMAKQMKSIEGWNTAKDISFICIFADKY